MLNSFNAKTQGRKVAGTEHPWGKRQKTIASLFHCAFALIFRMFKTLLATTYFLPNLPHCSFLKGETVRPWTSKTVLQLSIAGFFGRK